MSSPPRVILPPPLETAHEGPADPAAQFGASRKREATWQGPDHSGDPTLRRPCRRLQAGRQGPQMPSWPPGLDHRRAIAHRRARSPPNPRASKDRCNKGTSAPREPGISARPASRAPTGVARASRQQPTSAEKRCQRRRPRPRNSTEHRARKVDPCSTVGIQDSVRSMSGQANPQVQGHAAEEQRPDPINPQQSRTEGSPRHAGLGVALSVPLLDPRHARKPQNPPFLLASHLSLVFRRCSGLTPRTGRDPSLLDRDLEQPSFMAGYPLRPDKLPRARGRAARPR